MNRIFFVLGATFIPFLLLLYIYFEQESRYEEELLSLQGKKEEVIALAAKERDNIALHRVCQKKTFSHEAFQEHTLDQYPLFKEVGVYQKKPLFMKGDEIEGFLNGLEGVVGPQIIFQEFSLERIPSLEEEDLFKVEAKLIVREFL